MRYMYYEMKFDYLIFTPLAWVFPRDKIYSWDELD